MKGYEIRMPDGIIETLEKDMEKNMRQFVIF
jgi:hypothetical protein